MYCYNILLAQSICAIPDLYFKLVITQFGCVRVLGGEVFLITYSLFRATHSYNYKGTHLLHMLDFGVKSTKIRDLCRFTTAKLIGFLSNPFSVYVELNS